mgnify:FL=1|jgi:AcrR family transcriptional regulator
MSKRERTQLEILKAAKQIIDAEGHEAITVRKLSEFTGYSHTNLYYYFKNLDDLLWRLRLVVIEDMINELSNQSKDIASPINELLENLYRYIEYYFDHPNIFRFFYFFKFVKPGNDVESEKTEDDFDAMWKISFKKLVDEDLINVSDVEVVINTLIYSIHGIILLNLSLEQPIHKLSIKKQLEEQIYHLLKQKNSIEEAAK